MPVEQIIPFEWSTLEQMRFDCAWNDNDVVRHPFMVTPIENDEYLLLNQSELFYQLLAAGLNYLPVQISGQPDLIISSERLVLEGLGEKQLNDLVVQNPDNMALSESDSESPFPESVTVTLDFPNKTALNLHLRHSTRLGCPEPMARLFETIQRAGRFVPEIDQSGLDGTPLRSVRPDCILTLPQFELSDLISAARSDRLFPPNVLRITDGLKILNLDFPLRILRTDLPLYELEMFLKDLLAYRELARRTSYIEGRVYILNR